MGKSLKHCNTNLQYIILLMYAWVVLRTLLCHHKEWLCPMLFVQPTWWNNTQSLIVMIIPMLHSLHVHRQANYVYMYYQRYGGTTSDPWTLWASWWVWLFLQAWMKYSKLLLTFGSWHWNQQRDGCCIYCFGASLWMPVAACHVSQEELLIVPLIKSRVISFGIPNRVCHHV